MTRRVNPIEARKGRYIETYPLDEVEQMQRDAAHLQRVADNATRRLGMSSVEIVYTRMVMWGKRGDTWQIFAITAIKP